MLGSRKREIRREAPKFLFWLIAPRLGYTRKYLSRNVGYQIKFEEMWGQACNIAI